MSVCTSSVSEDRSSGLEYKTQRGLNRRPNSSFLPRASTSVMSWMDDSSRMDESSEASEALLWSDWLDALCGVWTMTDFEQETESC